jgi:hypothetical protein
LSSNPHPKVKHPTLGKLANRAQPSQAKPIQAKPSQDKTRQTKAKQRQSQSTPKAKVKATDNQNHQKLTILISEKGLGSQLALGKYQGTYGTNFDQNLKKTEKWALKIQIPQNQQLKIQIPRGL